MYQVGIGRTALRQIGALQACTAQRIRTAIADLSQDPRPPGVKKLHGEPVLWRIRVGSYRVVYSIDDSTRMVTVVKVADRRDVYR